MNNLTKTLLAGASFCALTTAPAMAQQKHPAFHVMARHGGHVVNKTKLHNLDRQHLTYTFGVYSSVSSSSLHKTQTLIYTFYKWSYSCYLGSPVKVKAPKKSEYGKIGWTTETYSNVCGIPGPSVFYGNTYKLTNPEAKGKTDHFVSTQIFKFTYHGMKYKGTANIDVSVTIY